MNLSISNIVWTKENDEFVYAIMKENGFVGLEIAPTRIFPEQPYNKLDAAKTWAKEFALKGRNIRVNAVAPGYTMTRMMETVPENLLEKFRNQTMLGRLAEPIEIANTVLFLASDLASYVTGEVLNVNGGMRL